MRPTYLVVILAACLSIVVGNIVHDLTDTNFEENITRGSWFVKFYAPWCGHCKRLSPTWEKLPSRLESGNLHVARVDCTSNEEVCREYGIRGYPTLKLFVDGELEADYSGARDVEALSNWMVSEVEAIRSELTQSGSSNVGLIGSDRVDEYALHHLTDLNFKQVTERGCWEILFYVPWQRESNKKLKEWQENAQPQERNTKCKYGIVDVSLFQKTAKQLGIEYLPDIYHVDEK